MLIDVEQSDLRYTMMGIHIGYHLKVMSKCWASTSQVVESMCQEGKLKGNFYMRLEVELELIGSRRSCEDSLTNTAE